MKVISEIWLIYDAFLLFWLKKRNLYILLFLADGSGQKIAETRQVETLRRDKKCFQDIARQKDTCRDKTRLLGSQKFIFGTRRDFGPFQNSETRQDKTAIPVSSRPGNRDEKFPDPSLSNYAYS